jgi:hypothetical protein
MDRLIPPELLMATGFMCLGFRTESGSHYPESGTPGI